MDKINLQAIGAMVVPNVGGWLGGLVTAKNLPWYESLNLVSWRPPNWAFAPIWTGLYTGMGYASYVVYRDGGGLSGNARLPLMAYGGQLLLNWAWTPIFFGAHSLKWSFFEIILLDAAAGGTGYLFYKVNPIAGYIFVPYMAWLSLATALNYFTWQLNPQGGDEGGEGDDEDKD